MPITTSTHIYGSDGQNLPRAHTNIQGSEPHLRHPKANHPPSILKAQTTDLSGHSPEAQVSHPHGIRAQLHHLLPRHTLFHVRVKVHQLASVPLVSGEFGLRWKFKHVQTSPTTKPGILGIKNRSRHRLGPKNDKGKEHDEEEDDNDSLGSADSSPDATVAATSITSADDNSSSVPSVVVSGHGRHPSSSQSTMSPPSITSGTSSHVNSSSSSDWSPYSSYTYTPSSTTSRTTVSNPLPSLATTTAPDAYAPARGMTPFVKLRDHNVTWEQTLDVIVKMDVDRDTANLLPNELKLVVMQRVIADDPDAPHNPRLGAVYLNLAEYASPGVVTRRYLLRESKTNATLKLTIQLEYAGGEQHYIAPPLPKGEILNGVAGLLESDVYRTRPRKLDLYGPYHDKQDLELDLLGGGDGVPRNSKDEGVPFDVERLPMAYGPKTTETLIEALFNPVKISEKRKESPFTYYVASGNAGKDSNGLKRRPGLTTMAPPAIPADFGPLPRSASWQVSEAASLYSTGSSSEDTYMSAHTNSTHSGSLGSHTRQHHLGEGVRAGVKGWFTKNRSRPNTPTPVR